MAIRNYFYCMLCILSKEKTRNKSINQSPTIYFVTNIFFYTFFNISTAWRREL